MTDIPCPEDRIFGLVQEHEMVMAFHSSRTDQILDDLRSSESYSGHCLKPFLRWSVIFAPDMEPRGTELD